MKYGYTLSIFVLLLLATSSSVVAQTESSKITLPTRDLQRQEVREQREEQRSERLEARKEENMEKLRARALKEIDKRVESLNKILAKISEMQKMSVSQKANYTAKIQAEITNLTNLKTKITAATDRETLKVDAKSIVTSFRVYALFIPQIHFLVAADRVMIATDKFSEITTKLQAKITQAQTAGNDVTTMQSQLADMQNKIANAKTQAQNVTATVSALTPEGYPGNKSVLQQAHTMLKSAREDLHIARKNAEMIIRGLRKLRTNRPSQATSAAETGAVGTSAGVVGR